MTSICPSGGTSSARPGYAATVAMTVPAIGALLNNIPTPWAVAFAALLGLVNYDLGVFCTIDPPTLPTLVAQDFLDILTLDNPVAHGVAQRKLQDFVSYYAWFQYCQCDSAVTPLPTAPQAQPTGMPAINPPGGGVYPTGAPCYTFVDSSNNMEARGDSNFHPLNGATSLAISVSTAAETLVSPHTFTVFVSFFDATPTFTGSKSWNINATGITNTTPAAVPAGSTQFRLGTATTNGDTANRPWTAQYDFYCGFPGGAGPSVAPVPCVADPFTTLMLQQILQLVTLIQREAVPFAYVPGPAHSGLTGSGTVAVQGILGVLLNVSVPARSGLEVGTPDTVFGVGWLNFGTADGYTDRVFIHTDSQLVYPPVAGQFTLVGYSLEPDVSMTMTELLREP